MKNTKLHVENRKQEIVEKKKQERKSQESGSSAYLFPGFLVQLVHRTADGAELLRGAAADLENGVEDHTVVELHAEAAGRS